MLVATLSQFPEFKELMPEQSRPPGPELKPKSLWTPCLCVVRGCTLDVFSGSLQSKATEAACSRLLICPSGASGNVQMVFFLVNHRRGGSILQALSNWQLAFPFAAMSCLSNIHKRLFFFLFFSLPPEPARRKQPMPVYDSP